MNSIRCIAALLCLIPSGCGDYAGYIQYATGYHEIDGEWVWVFRSARAGSEVTKLDADHDSFVVLDNNRYAKDKHRVFLESATIDGADPSTFQLLDANCYAKDKSHVYLRKYRIPDADPDSFRVLAGPYSRDACRVYCGNVPMDMADVDAFEVVKDWGLMVTSNDKSDFLFHYGEAFKDIEVSIDHPALTGECWARDGKYWYYGPGRIEGADYNSFKVNDRLGQASDKNRKYVNVFPEEELPARQRRLRVRQNMMPNSFSASEIK